MIAIVLVISLLLNNFLLLNINYQVNELTLFTPLFYIVALTLLYPFFNKNIDKYYITAFLYGLLYDVISDTFLLNAILFLSVAIFIKNMRHLFMNNLINNMILITLAIVLYDSLLFMVLVFLNRIDFEIYDLLYKLSHSIFGNLIYGIVLYITLNILSNRFNIKKID